MPACLPHAPAGPTLESVQPLRLAYLALAVGLMGFGLVWGWLGLRAADRAPLGLRVAAGLALLLALLGAFGAVVLEPRAPW